MQSRFNSPRIGSLSFHEALLRAHVIVFGFTLLLNIGLSAAVAQNQGHTQDVKSEPVIQPQPSPARSGGPPTLTSWKPIYQGVEYQPFQAESPRRISGHAIRIHLQTPGIAFVVTPGNGERPLEVDSVTTSRFLKRHGLQVAINAAPFYPVINQEGIPQEVVGLAVSEGMLVSDSDRQFGAILIDSQNHAKILQQPPPSLEGIRHACGGFQIILENGKATLEEQKPEPRSAVGISQDGAYLILLVIDGRQPRHSEGATLRETAEWLIKLGAWSGLNLDGGGSTSLAIESPAGQAKLLNRPIHLRIPGLERPCPNHLGVRARALEPR